MPHYHTYGDGEDDGTTEVGGGEETGGLGVEVGGLGVEVGGCQCWLAYNIRSAVVLQCILTLGVDVGGLGVEMGADGG